MPPRRRRGGIWNPAQDAQLKEAEDLLNSLTGAADMTTAEIQRTLRAPRLDALPPRAITRRRNVPELGGIDALRLAAGEPASIRFEWRQGALTVVGFVDAASEARAKRAGAVLDARLVSCNGVALQGKSQGQVMQRMQSTASLARQLGFAPPLITEPPPPGPQSPPAKAKRFASNEDDPAAARKRRLARAAAAANLLKAKDEPQKPFAAMEPSQVDLQPQPPSLDAWLGRAPAPAVTTKVAAHADPYSTGARRRRITHEHASRVARPLIAEALRRVQRRRLETLAAVAAQRRRRGLKGRRKAAQRRYWRLYAAAVAVQASVRGHQYRLRRLVAAVLLAQCFIRRLRARRLLRRMRAQRFRTRAEACLTAQRVLRGRRGRRVAARLRRARVGARRFFAIAREGVRARVFLRWLRDTKRGKRLAAAAQRWWRLLVRRWRWRAMLRRCRTLFPVARARATRMRRDAAWAAWRAAFQKRRRDDAIRAFQAARAAAELLRLLAAKRGYSSSSSSAASISDDDNEEKACPMSPRRCIKCGNVGRVPMASTDGLCVECINERYMSAKRLELRRRGLAAVRLQRRIRGAAEPREVTDNLASRRPSLGVVLRRRRLRAVTRTRKAPCRRVGNGDQAKPAGTCHRPADGR